MGFLNKMAKRYRRAQKRRQAIRLAEAGGDPSVFYGGADDGADDAPPPPPMPRRRFGAGGMGGMGAKLADLALPAAVVVGAALVAARSK